MRKKKENAINYEWTDQDTALVSMATQIDVTLVNTKCHIRIYSFFLAIKFWILTFHLEGLILYNMKIMKTGQLLLLDHNNENRRKSWDMHKIEFLIN